VLTPVFDGHNDVLTAGDHAAFATGRPEGHLDLARMATGGLRGGIFAIFTPSARDRRLPLVRTDTLTAFEFASPVSQRRAAAHATAVAGRLFALERAGLIRVARTIGDVDATFGTDDGPPVAVLHLEGAEAIDPELEALSLWHAAGLRSLGPVWSRPNAFAEGVPFLFGAGPDTGPGLTDAGTRLVQRCGELGILVDLAHLNEAGFWDVAALEVGPLVASHTGAVSIAETSRNLTDAQLDAVAASGGIVGIASIVYFLTRPYALDPDIGLAPIVEHIRYVADRIGVEHVGLGSDFDGGLIPSELGGADGLPRLLAALGNAGFSPDEVEAIAWRNWRRVLEAWWR
jgi:membrane dipeptidase